MTAIVLAGVAGMLATLAVVALAEEVAAAARARGRMQRRALPALLARAGRALAAHPALSRRLARGGAEQRLTAAGLTGVLSLRDWVALKLGCSLAGLVLAAIVAPDAPLRFAALIVLVGPAAGFAAPDAWLARRARRRTDAAARDLPDMIDLLCVTLAAGLHPLRALGVVAAELDGPLAREWGRAANEAALGLPADAALAGLEQRVPHEDVRALTQAVRRGLRHGAPLRRALAAQAVRVRHRRAQRAREHAARAGPKIQLAVALVLVPSVLLMVGAGLIAEVPRSGLWVGP